MALNCKELLRVFECSARLTYNLTKTRFELLTAPFRHSLKELPNNVTHINRSFRKIKNVVLPLRDEFEMPDINATAISNRTLRQATPSVNSKHVVDSDEADAVRLKAFYMEKIRSRCQQQLERGRDKCRQAFQDTYDKCMAHLPFGVGILLCWPMKFTVVCRAAMLQFGEICDPTQAIHPSMGHDYVELHQIMGMMAAVKVNVSTAGGKNILRRIEQYTRFPH